MVVSLHMGWRHLLFANWPVPPAEIRRAIPDSLAVDTYDGDAWLSATPFTNVDVRPRFLPAGTGQRLPELNLRTYVTYDGVPAVYFFSLDADGALAVIGAKLFHHLPYYFADITLDRTDDEIRFTSRRRHPGARPARFSARYRPVGSMFHAIPDSLEEFLTARYRYYTESPAGELRYARIDHEPWPLYDAEAELNADDLFRANGFEPPTSDPMFLYSPGVDTIASRSLRAERGR